MKNLILLLGAGVAVYTLLSKNEKQKSSIPSSTLTKTYSPFNNSDFNVKKEKDIVPINQAKNFPLRFGSRGNEVKLMQEAILKSGNTKAAYHVKSTGGADGIFGSGTQKAINELGYGSEVSVNEYAQLLVQVGITTTQLSDLL